MRQTIETIDGHTDGVRFTFATYRFDGPDPTAPTAYIQAALHAGELPGTVAIHMLMPKLRSAEREGRVRGAITIVPAANPVGRAQYHFGGVEGRFHLGSRTNFNRDFPLLDRPDASGLDSDPSMPDAALKSRLIGLSLGHDIVLDLHCDDEGVLYLYVPAELWPAMSDCAAAIGVEAVILWSGGSGASFDEASLHPWLKAAPSEARLANRVITTVEYRGLADVDAALAQSDADGLYRLLVARGVVADTDIAKPSAYAGIVAPIENVELIAAPRGGAILFDVRPGDRVASGDRLARIVAKPGEEDGTIDVLAPQSGYVLTRSSRRSAHAGEDIIKLIGDRPSQGTRQGALED